MVVKTLHYPDNHLEPEYSRLKKVDENMAYADVQTVDDYHRRFEKYFAPGLIRPVEFYEYERWLENKIPELCKRLGFSIQWRLDPFGRMPWQVEIESFNPPRARSARGTTRADATVVAMVEWYEGNIYRVKEDKPPN